MYKSSYNARSRKFEFDRYQTTEGVNQQLSRLKGHGNETFSLSLFNPSPEKASKGSR
jgi:hypothetical protein